MWGKIASDEALWTLLWQLLYTQKIIAWFILTKAKKKRRSLCTKNFTWWLVCTCCLSTSRLLEELHFDGYYVGSGIRVVVPALSHDKSQTPNQLQECTNSVNPSNAFTCQPINTRKGRIFSKKVWHPPNLRQKWLTKIKKSPKKFVAIWKVGPTIMVCLASVFVDPWHIILISCC